MLLYPVPNRARTPQPQQKRPLRPFRYVTITSENRPESRTWAPYIRIRGKWLQAAGFDYGDKVQIHVEHSKLIIIKQA